MLNGLDNNIHISSSAEPKTLDDEQSDCDRHDGGYCPPSRFQKDMML